MHAELGIVVVELAGILQSKKDTNDIKNRNRKRNNVNNKQ
jgi:hypothetical protein